MAAKLYVVPASHPCAAVERALQLKGIAYERVDLPPVIHKAVTKVRFGVGTVPALELDGGRVSGSRLIMRTLDAAVPEPPLLPADPAQRGRVEDAERWGDEILQSATRRLSWAALSRRADAMRSFSVGSGRS
jgi:glutathione S-transferase